jgi:hypothetical protein
MWHWNNKRVAVLDVERGLIYQRSNDSGASIPLSNKSPIQSTALYVTFLAVTCPENAHTRNVLSPQRRSFANVVVKICNAGGVGQHIGERVWQSKQLRITNEAWKPIISMMEHSQHRLPLMAQTTQIPILKEKTTHNLFLQKRRNRTHSRTWQTKTPRRLVTL